MMGCLYLQVYFILLRFTWDVQQPPSFNLLTFGGGGSHLPDLLFPLAFGSGDSSLNLYSELTHLL